MACAGSGRGPSPAPTTWLVWANVASVRRVLEIAVLDALGLDNSLARSKVLIGAVATAAKLLEAEREEAWAKGWEEV